MILPPPTLNLVSPNSLVWPWDSLENGVTEPTKPLNNQRQKERREADIAKKEQNYRMKICRHFKKGT